MKPRPLTDSEKSNVIEYLDAGEQGEAVLYVERILGCSQVVAIDVVDDVNIERGGTSNAEQAWMEDKADGLLDSKDYW